MTLTLELSPQTETRLRAIAQEKGATLEAVALKRLDVSLLSEEELEALEDELDMPPRGAPRRRQSRAAQNAR
jgi:hypothetical protein